MLKTNVIHLLSPGEIEAPEDLQNPLFIVFFEFLHLIVYIKYDYFQIFNFNAGFL